MRKSPVPMTNSLHHSWFLAIGLRDICVGAVYASSHTTALMASPASRAKLNRRPTRCRDPRGSMLCPGIPSASAEAAWCFTGRCNAGPDSGTTASAPVAHSGSRRTVRTGNLPHNRIRVNFLVKTTTDDYSTMSKNRYIRRCCLLLLLFLRE
jgi:hypothetical protein